MAWVGWWVHTFDQLAGAHHMRVRMIDGHIEAQRLQEHVLVEHKLLGEFGVILLGGRRQALVGGPNNMLQLPRLLFYLGGQEEARRRHGVAMKVGEGVKGVEPMHVHNGRVDAQLGHLQTLTHFLYQIGGHLAVLQLIVALDAASSAWRIGQLIVAEVPDLVLLERQVVVGGDWNTAGRGGRGGG